MTQRDVPVIGATDALLPRNTDVGLRPYIPLAEWTRFEYLGGNTTCKSTLCFRHFDTDTFTVDRIPDKHRHASSRSVLNANNEDSRMRRATNRRLKTVADGKRRRLRRARRGLGTSMVATLAILHDNDRMPNLYLASTSPARLSVLRAAGVNPIVRPSAVDEDALVAATETEEGPLTTEDLVIMLARAKAEALIGDPEIDGYIVGGDSNFEFDGVHYGKPHDPEVARQRISALQGDHGTLYSGTWVIDHRGGVPRAALGAAARAVVYFDTMSPAEIDRYIATREPLEVAGSFTLDGLGSAFIDRIDGDPSCVIGLSIPLLRKLIGQLGGDWTAFWNERVL